MTRIIFLILIALSFLACENQQNNSTDNEPEASSEPLVDTLLPQGQPPTHEESSMPSLPREEAVMQLSGEVIQLLKRKDMKTLSTYVHPEKGLTLTPTVFVSESNQTLKSEEIPQLFESEQRINWGTEDGSGKPIQLTFGEYYKRYIFDVDFSQSEEVSFDKVNQRGNTINNARKAYQDGAIVEYYIPGVNPKFGGMDWRALRLVFESSNGKWYLVGIIHATWTI